MKASSNAKPVHILLSGPQGCGKTTQANLVAMRYNFCLIKAGDLLRQYAAQPGNEALLATLNSGDFVDDQMLADLIKARLAEPLCHDGIVTDGYPRRMSQLEVFDPQFDYVFEIKISDAEAVKRLTARGRSDDTPEVILKRLANYHAETEPVLDYYAKQGKLVEINGEQSIEDVYQAIISHLEKINHE